MQNSLMAGAALAAATEENPGFGEVLRTMAHDLRQPLGTIESIAYYLDLVLPREDAKGREQLRKIQLLVEQSNWILSNGTELAKPRRGCAAAVDLEEALSEAAAPYALDRQAPVELRLAGNLPLIEFDPGQLRRLLQNLMVLLRQLSGGMRPTEAATEAAGSGVSLLLRFGNPGDAAAGPPPAGVSLSLEHARRALTPFGGTVELEAAPPRHAQARVWFRRAAAQG